MLCRKRSAVFPNVPTFSELGHADVDMTFWIGLWASAGTPPAAIGRLNRDLNAKQEQLSEYEERIAILRGQMASAKSRYDSLRAPVLPALAMAVADLAGGSPL